MSKASERAVEFSQLAEAMADAPDDDARHKVAVEFALTVVAASTHAGLTVLDVDHGLVTKASSDETVCRANALQHDLGEGPCFDVGVDQEIVVATDLAHESRWSAWGPMVDTELGVKSVMTVLMSSTRKSTVALTLYAERDHAFDPDDVEVARALVRQVGTGVTTGRQIEELRLAMHSRLAIGQAQGIVMERLKVTSDQAFEYLRRLSSLSNRKVVDIARDIASTRKLPDLDSEGTVGRSLSTAGSFEQD